MSDQGLVAAVHQLHLTNLWAHILILSHHSQLSSHHSPHSNGVPSPPTTFFPPCRLRHRHCPALTIHHYTSRYSSRPAPTCSDQRIAAEVLRDEFIHAQSVDDVQPEVDEAGEATTLFFARFIGFVADRVRATLEDSPEHVARLAILLRAVSHSQPHSSLISISTPSSPRMSMRRARRFCPHSTWHAPSLWNMT